MQNASAPVLAGSRILIVEDEFLVAMDLEDRLKREGCGVIGPAPRETKALALLEQGRPDAVVLDLNLGGKLPVDLANILVARQIPFVIVTGYGSRHLDVPALQAAPRVHKPIRTEELVHALSDLLPRCRSTT
jgi:DNA-binding response OmpR family regulator